MKRAEVRSQKSEVSFKKNRSFFSVHSPLTAVFCLLLAFHLSPFAASISFAIEQPTVEGRLTAFIKQFYNDSEDIYVKFNNSLDLLKEKTRVRHIDFAKIPDANGDGLCLVEIDMKHSRPKNIYVSFKVQNKKRLFVLKQNGKKGDVISSKDIFVKNAYMTDNSATYPAQIEDIAGKALKRETAAGTVITYQMLEDSFAVQRGETVNIVAENKKLLVQTKGKTLEKGKIGDIIRVKNLTSDKEILGRVFGSGTIRVDL